MKQRIVAIALLAAGMIVILALASGSVNSAIENGQTQDSIPTELRDNTPNPGGGAQSSKPGDTKPGEGKTDTGGTNAGGARERAPANPLTGLPMSKEAAGRRPVAVMLNNLKQAVPQLGVSQADIIYEVPAEGGVTRMLALYQSLDGVGNLGSIRSTRPYYLEIALGHDALLVHAGASSEAYRDITSWDVDNMDGVRGQSDAKIFWRDSARRRNMGYEHSLLTSGEKIQKYLDEGHFRTEHRASYFYNQDFTPDGTPQNGTDAKKVEVKFSSYKTGVFQYDAEGGQYMIRQYGAAYTDGNTGKQVGVTNVLVLETAMTVLDKEGRLQVTTSSVGKGQFFCGGKSVPIRWQKADRNSPFLYTLEDGSPLALGTGSSYICLIDGKNASVTISG